MVANIFETILLPFGRNTLTRKGIIVRITVAAVVLVILFKFEFLKLLRREKKQVTLVSTYIEKIINPPRYISKYHNDTVYELYNNLKIVSNNESQMLKEKLADVLSEIVQAQLEYLQKSGYCDGPNIICGHSDKCGMGCQIHHRIACLMISYALNFPLIHDESNWSYTNSWSEAFFPLGNTCRPGLSTYRVAWVAPYPTLHGFIPETDNPDAYNKSKQIEYPLKNGIPVAKGLAELVDIVHENPFMWWVGQFMKFGLRLSPNQEESLETTKALLKFEHPIVGFHVRRTDKRDEASDSYHSIEEYMVEADNYYTDSRRPKNIFIASDDSEILKDARHRYASSEWNIVGFTSRTTSKDQLSREMKLDEIVQDLFILSECDFVVCGLTSNVCRLLLEILNHLHLDGMRRLKSLDGDYQYVLFGSRIKQMINKI